MEDAVEVTAVMDARLALPYSLAFWYCSHQDSSSLHWGEQGLVGELRLVLLRDPVSGLLELHCMLLDHDFKHFLHLGVGGMCTG